MICKHTGCGRDAMLTESLCDLHSFKGQPPTQHDASATIRYHAATARSVLVAQLMNDVEWAHLVELAIERASTLGVAEYGTGAWDKTRPGLYRETDQELADAIFYVSVAEDIV